MQSIQPEFFTAPLIKYTRPSRYDFAPHKTSWIFSDGDYKEVYIQQSENLEQPIWERMGIELERRWLEERENMKWIKKGDLPWRCPHVNKTDVLIEEEGNVYVWTTDYPEPIGDYKFIFLHELLDQEYLSPRRVYLRNECKCWKS
jgi:hypothetical protein